MGLPSENPCGARVEPPEGRGQGQRAYSSRSNPKAPRSLPTMSPPDLSAMADIVSMW